MYKTIKVLLAVNKQQGKVLKRYTQGYRFEIARLCHSNKRMEVDHFIHDKSRWYVVKQVKAYREKRKSINLGEIRYAIFSANSFVFDQRNIILYFGESFYLDKLSIAMSLERSEYELMLQQRILRMDLIYDGNWYANFLISERG